MKKAQSAMEYLMTYGWAILIVIIVAAALYALGIFNPATYTQSTAVGFQGFQVPTGGWQFTSNGQLTLQLRNMAGSNIEITNVTATYAGRERYNDTTYQLSAGDTYTITISGFPLANQGTPYSITVEITYTNLDTGLSGFRSSGTLTGTVS